MRRAGLFVLLAPALSRAQAVREVHGAADVFAEPGLALAWGLQRGADEAGTRVWLRVIADPARYARVDVTGRDPFGGGTRIWLAGTVVNAAAIRCYTARADRRPPAHGDSADSARRREGGAGLVAMFGRPVAVALLAFAMLEVAAAVALLRRRSWARCALSGVGAAQLVIFPIGTALALYTLWALLSGDEPAPRPSGLGAF